MNVLIIGAQGFIGANLLQYFKKSYASNELTVYGADIQAAPDIQFVLDAAATDFTSLFTASKYDVCINCSGAANVQASFRDPSFDFRLNTFNVEQLLNAIRIHQPGCRFINLSSAAVYGNPQTIPITEASVTAPLSPYGYHKLMSEQLLAGYASAFGLETLSLRIFSAYGEGLKKQLFWDLYQKIKSCTDAKVHLFGTGKESRDFIHVHDIARAVDLIIKKANFNGGVINVASGIETFIADVVNDFLLLLPVNLEADFTGEYKIGDPVNWRADISKLKQLGFEPEVTLREGLKKYIQWAGESV